jgi:hypothetical protein
MKQFIHVLTASGESVNFFTCSHFTIVPYGISEHQVWGSGVLIQSRSTIEEAKAVILSILEAAKGAVDGGTTILIETDDF